MNLFRLWICYTYICARLCWLSEILNYFSPNHCYLISHKKGIITGQCFFLYNLDFLIIVGWHFQFNVYLRAHAPFPFFHRFQMNNLFFMTHSFGRCIPMGVTSEPCNIWTFSSNQYSFTSVLARSSCEGRGHLPRMVPVLCGHTNTLSSTCQ